MKVNVSRTVLIFLKKVLCTQVYYMVNHIQGARNAVLEMYSFKRIYQKRQKAKKSMIKPSYGV